MSKNRRSSDLESNKVKDFKELKAAKNGEVTPKALINNLNRAIEEGQIESVVYVVRLSDGEIRTGYSNVNQTEVVGLLECGKMNVFNDMYEE